MPTTVQFRRGTTSQLSNFTGANGELVVDTTVKTLKIHDGSTQGGIELMRKDFSNAVSTVTRVYTTATTIDSFATASYRSARYNLSIKDNVNSEYETCDVSLVHNGTTVSLAVIGSNYTGASSRMSFTATIAAGTLTFQGLGTSDNNTVKFIRTLLPV